MARKLDCCEMPTSQNVRFCCELQPENAMEHPPGGSIARLVREDLVERGWNPSELDNWRDSGWVFFCPSKNAELQLVLAPMATPSHWLLQISPKHLPGVIGRLFGRRTSASITDVYAIATDVHETISKLADVTSIQWCWDGVPQDNNSSQEPTMPSDSEHWR
jgi:hypothetical protein